MKRIITTFMAMLFIATTLPMSAQDDTRLQSQAKKHLKDYAKNYQLSPKDVSEFIITDEYTSKGITHTYFRQAYQGIEVFGANAAVHAVNDKVIASNNEFVSSLETRIQKSTASLSVIEAIESLAKEKNFATKTNVRILEQKSGARNNSLTLSGGNISRSDIPARLVYAKTENGDVVLAWNLTVEDVNSADILDVRVDANTGAILEEHNWTIYCDFGDGNIEESGCSDDHGDHCDHSGHSHTYAPAESANAVVANSYNVFPYPIESPNFGSRSIVANPEAANTVASPDGWHEINGTTYTVSRGNNTDTYLDNDSSNGPTGGDAARVEGGANLEFDFPWTASGAQTTYTDAALTNLFYWTNITHDVWYNYGFDEPSGNFQEYNFNRGGNQGDGVLAEAQDGAGTCNANFGTPADGGNPRMQMFLCNNRDGDYDNGVIVHEYGHGISTRLTGGPASPGCLSNQEQMGEGWSDWFGNMMTIEAGDQGSDSRGMGTWLFGQGPTGNGIRPFPYSTDMSVNPMTYATIGSGVSVPHGVGSVWATMLWDLSWAFIDEYGYDADLYNGTGGNNMAMALVIEGLKLQPCSPGFVDGRDAIIAADQAINGGANECMIWEVFARRGLGFSASQGSSSSVSDGTEAFDMPPSCSIGLSKTANVTEVAPGGQITYSLTATNNTGSTLNNVVISDDLPANTSYVSGGSLSGNTVSFPAVNLAVGGSVTRIFTVEVDPGLDGTTPDFSDDMESGAGNWTTGGTGAGTGFGLQTNTANSGSTAWFAADVSTNSQRTLTIATTVGLSDASTMSFTHLYNTENNWDGGLVEISTDGGTNWTDLGSAMTANGYNGRVNNNVSTPAFSGNSNGFLTTQVDLSAYGGQNVLVRFRMSCDFSVGGEGWYIDDVMIGGLATYIPNTAQVTDGNIVSEATLGTPTLVIEGTTPPLVASTSGNDVTCNGGNDGSASVSVTGGTGVYTYTWSNGATTATVTGLSAGTYTVDINDGDETISATVTIGEPSALLVVATGTDTSCGDDNGTASASGADSYTWSNGATGSTLTGLSAGTYTVTGTNADGCTGTATVTVGGSSATSVSATSTDTTCGDDNGTASASGADSYSWSNGATGSTITGLSAGTYTVTGTTNGCTDIATVTVGGSNATSISATSTDTTCGDDNGTASASGADSYSWSNGATGSTITGLSAGTYTVTGTTNGCTDTATVTVGGSSATSISATSTDTTCGDDNGTVSASGADSYTWSNGATGATLTGLSAGTYTVTGTTNGCTDTATVTVDGSSATNVSATGTDASCGENNGSASASGADSYTWSNGATGATITGLSAGTYTVTGTTNGCTDTATVTIGASNNINVSATSTDTTCGEDNGTASASGADSYSWSNGGTGSTITGLSAGTYTVTGTTNGCTDTATVTVGGSSATNVSATSTDTTCGDDNGTASASGADSYSWSNGATGVTITGLSAGTYTVTGTTNGCTDTATVTVGGSSATNVSVTSTDTTCGDDNGTASASGADSYSWSNGATGATITGLSAGTYTVTGTTNGCTDTATVTVGGSDNPTASISGTNANGGNNGTADLTVMGGVAPYTYAWSNGATSEDLTGLAEGSYDVLVTDANGCTTDATVTIGDDTTPPTECDENGMTLSLIVDNWPQETSWELTDANGAVIAAEAYTTATPDGSTLVIPFCVPDGCYDFTIYDSYGDGICCAYGEGSYQITDDITGEVLASGAAFGSTETTEICFGDQPLPPVTYCGSNGNNQNYEYIQAVTMGSINNASGNDGGYGDYTALTTSANAGDVVNFSLTPGFVNSTYTERWRVWVDFNRDGDFSDAGERVYSGGSSSTINGSFTIPAGAVNGDLRIRVSMKWGRNPRPCESFTYGEVEDYTLLVGVSNFGGGADERNSFTGEPEFFTYTERGTASGVTVYPNPVSSILNVNVNLETEGDATIIMTDLSGKNIISTQRLDGIIGSQTVRMDVSELIAGVYFVQLITEESTITERVIVVK